VVFGPDWIFLGGIGVPARIFLGRSHRLPTILNSNNYMRTNTRIGFKILNPYRAMLPFLFDFSDVVGVDPRVYPLFPMSFYPDFVFALA
jgi:hypothetical protein